MKGTQAAADTLLAPPMPPRGRCADPATFYETRLAQDSRWALSEGSLFFEGKGAVQETLRRITARLAQERIDYAVVDGMALFHHGVRRFIWTIDPRGLKPKTLSEMITALPDAAEMLRAMLTDGVTLDPDRGVGVYLVATDPEVAKKYDMHDESEFLTRNDDETGA